MKALTVILSALCLVTAVPAIAGWEKTPEYFLKVYATRPNMSTPTICCSADGRIVYMVINEPEDMALGKTHIFMSKDGGETWYHQDIPTFVPWGRKGEVNGTKYFNNATPALLEAQRR